MSQKEISVTVGAQQVDPPDPYSHRPTFTCGQDPAVSSAGGDLNVNAYYTNTVITLRSAGGLILGSGAGMSRSSVDRSVFEYGQESNQITIRVTNSQKSGDAEARIIYTIDLLDVSSGRKLTSFHCNVSAKPRQMISVHFDPNARPRFTYDGDIVTTSVPPSITVSQDQGVMFTLVSAALGAAFDSAEPFVWDDGEPDHCIADVGTNGTTAVLTDLFEDGTQAGTPHGFRLQVTCGGATYRSEDPTVVNVDPDQP